MKPKLTELHQMEGNMFRRSGKKGLTNRQSSKPPSMGEEISCCGAVCAGKGWGMQSDFTIILTPSSTHRFWKTICRVLLIGLTKTIARCCLHRIMTPNTPARELRTSLKRWESMFSSGLHTLQT